MCVVLCFSLTTACPPPLAPPSPPHPCRHPRPGMISRVWASPRVCGCCTGPCRRMSNTGGGIACLLHLSQLWDTISAPLNMVCLLFVLAVFFILAPNVLRNTDTVLFIQFIKFSLESVLLPVDILNNIKNILAESITGTFLVASKYVQHFGLYLWKNSVP